MNKLCFLLLLACVAGTLAAPKDKEVSGKKKALGKSRSDLEAVESGEAAKVTEEAVVEKVDPVPAADAVKEPEAVTDSVASEPEKAETAVEVAADSSVEKPRPSYLMRVKNLLRRVLEILGLSKQKRGARRLHDGNFIEDEPPYTQEVRAAVGAILGREECLKKAACGAGTMLRHVRGKEVLIVLLEKFSPTSWSDSINHIRNAAVFKDPCDYKCLEE